ncbi:MAG TPA: hypothetical protein VMF57_15485 [Solirubrobacteraceae bacterium]|nr:hypothetical protein [Solirubrobacteraceae bacterium]
MIGIVGELALRAVFIAIGATMLEKLSFTYLLLGLALTATAVQLFRHRAGGPSIPRNVVVAAARRRGVRPALLVFAANAFALLGLRALFFLVSGLLARLAYLSIGLAGILAFIGAKLVLHFAHLHSEAVPEISTGVSLAVIALALAVTTAASLLRTRSISARSSSDRRARRPRTA